MIPRRILATAITALFLAMTFAPLVGASTEATQNGDVIVNGDFADATPRGHVAKAYCLPCSGNMFVAYDWTAPLGYAANVSLPAEGGIRVPFVAGDTHFIQQHFNGSEAPDRFMKLYKVAVTGSASGASSKLRVEIRADTDADGTVENYQRSVTLLSTSTTTTLSAVDLGILATDEIKLRSIRIWVEGPSDALLTRVSVYASNGTDARNILILPTGDDVISELDGVGLLNAGDDGFYSFKVGIASDAGEFLPTLDAWMCAFTAEQAIADQGYPTNTPDQMCVDSIFDPEHASIVKTRDGAAMRVDVPAGLVRPTGTQIGAVAFYAHIKIDGTYRETPQSSPEFKSGYFTLSRMAAAAAGAGVSQEQMIATPVFIDADANGRPDFVSTQDTDGYAVIITPLLSTATPLATVMTTDVNSEFLFDVQVYKYDGATGAAMDIPRGISLGLFDADSALSGGTADSTPFWRTGDEGSELERIDAKTWRVHVPASAVKDHTLAGAWAFYNVGNGQVTNVFGRSTSSTDFYSSIRNAVKDSAAADGMRSAMTPIAFDAKSVTRDAVVVIRADPGTDTLTALDGTLVLDDNGDGSVAFEYALVFPDSVRTPGGSSHALSVYDAAAAASDGFSPGNAGMEHALWTTQGVAQGDGWFRAEVPTDVFASAKGAVGVWAYVNDVHPTGYVLSRSGWYNALKPALATVSTSAANATLYEPTPVVVVEHGLGIQQGLASAIAGAGSDLLSIHNPLVNPGFEAEILIEGTNDAADNTGGTMTAPPWFLRLDDKGTGQPTDPKSTHSVAHGKGRLTDNALKVSFSAADKGKALMLGQILGSAGAGDAYVWQGASGVGLDVHPLTPTDITFSPVVRYELADGTVASRSARATYTETGQWGHVDFALPNIPADARILGFYLVMDAASSTTFYLDNIVLKGTKTALGDTRSDITDGYAVVITPTNLVGAQQSLMPATDGAYYAYTVEIVDHTQGSPRTVDVSSVDKAFALRTQELQKGGADILALRDRSDAFAAVVASGDVPARAAVPWAFANVGEAYPQLDGLVMSQPASGHYNPMKNQLAFMPLSDQLDYAATPVVFNTSVVGTVPVQQLRLVGGPSSYQLEVKAAGDFVETTIVTLSAPGQPDATYPVTLTSDAGDVVPGLSLTPEQLNTVTIATADTRFTRGARLVAGSPIAQFEVCRPLEDETCLDLGILTNELLTFRSTSMSPAGERLTAVWRFGDGRVSTETDDVTTHTYTRPGVVTANLTIQTPSGKRAYAEQALTINNRAPTIAGIDITPTTVFTDSSVRARVRAADVDGGQLAYSWTVDGIPVTGASQATLPLTEQVLIETTGVPTLEKRAYVIGVTVRDGQNGVTSGTQEFVVVDRPASVSAPAFAVRDFGGDFALAGDTLDVNVTFEDADSIPARISLAITTPGGPAPLVELVDTGEGAWSGSFVAPAGTPGELVAVATAYDADDAVLATSPAGVFEVRANLPPLVLITGPAGVDVGVPTTFNATAVDPEGRGVGAITLEGADVTDNGDGTFAVVFDTIGDATLTATATDAHGAEGEGTLDVSVDDAIAVTMEIVSEPQTETQGYLVRIRVADANGAPIGGAGVVVEDLYSVLPAPVQTQRVITDPDGSIVVRLRPEAVVVGLPMTRTVVATATAGSLPDAPVQDDETAVSTMVLRNTAGPLGGLPLP